LLLLAENKYLTGPEIAKAVGVNERTVKCNKISNSLNRNEFEIFFCPLSVLSRTDLTDTYFLSPYHLKKAVKSQRYKHRIRV
ncbi:hypothetical protein, partial [Priestia endophytica]|uniref:hypothetical protein n=1 Tax=Priestia endophytica TaxID=135735 RepID=UPI0022804208